MAITVMRVFSSRSAFVHDGWKGWEDFTD